MSEIDWSKAPEGATHYDRDFGFFCNSEGFWSNYNEWHPVCRQGHYAWVSDRYIPRPTKQEWEGGLPPVGEVVTPDWSYLRYRVEWVGGYGQVLVSEIGLPDKLKITTPDRLRRS